MGTDKDIQILLTTYNGEKYLREQLDSYVALNGFRRVKVLIRDDGSTDGTKGILEEYGEKYGFDVIYGENLGVNGSVKVLFDECDMSCEYFAISDQDDVWLPHKLSAARECLGRLPKDRPAVFASPSTLVSETLDTLGETAKISRGLGFYNAMVQNVLCGHTQVLNKEMIKTLRESDLSSAVMFDWWIYMVAAAIGNIAFDDKPAVLHRQHGENTIGYGTNMARRTLSRSKRLFGGYFSRHTTQLASFLGQYGHMLSPPHADEVSGFIHSQKSFISRLKYVFTSNIYRQAPLETFAVKLLYAAGGYKIKE